MTEFVVAEETLRASITTRKRLFEFADKRSVILPQINDPFVCVYKDGEWYFSTSLVVWEKSSWQWNMKNGERQYGYVCKARSIGVTIFSSSYAPGPAIRRPGFRAVPSRTWWKDQRFSELEIATGGLT